MDRSNMAIFLSYLFEQARMIHQSASKFSGNQDDIRIGCHALEMCEEMIRKLGLFPPNATKDEIITTNLKYILVPYYLGELIEKRSEDNRIQVLRDSQVKLKEFISVCESMELVTQEELDSYVPDQRARKACVTEISVALCKAFDLLKMIKKEEDLLFAMVQAQYRGDILVSCGSKMESLTDKVNAFSLNIQLLNWAGLIIGTVLTSSIIILSHSVHEVKKDFSSTVETASSQMKKVPPSAMARAEKLIVSTTKKASEDAIVGFDLVVSKLEGIASTAGRDFKLGAGILGVFIASAAGIMKVFKLPRH